MTEAILREELEGQVGLALEPMEPVEVAKPKKKAKAKAKPKKKAVKRNVVTKADLEVQVKELTERVELAENKSEILFKENLGLKSRLEKQEYDSQAAFRMLAESINLALNMSHMAIK